MAWRSLAGSVLLTVTVAGWLVVFIMHAGTIDFIGILMEPIMRPVFRVPGEAAVDGIASFVSAPAVGVYLTSQLYEQSVYTEQEATAIITNSVFAVLDFWCIGFGCKCSRPLSTSCIDIIYHYIYIGCHSNKDSCQYQKRKLYMPMVKYRIYMKKKEDEFKGNLISKAFALALKTASGLTIKTVYIALWEALKFAQKIVAYVITIATVTMLITHYILIIYMAG